MADTPKPLSEKSDAELKREAKARIRHMDPLTATELVNEQVKDSVTGFVGFLRDNAVLSLAIGFVLGSQVQKVIIQLIDSFINPLFGLFFPYDPTHPENNGLSSFTFTFHLGSHAATLGWGALIYALIDFLVIAGTFYAMIKILKLDKLKPNK